MSCGEDNAKFLPVDASSYERVSADCSKPNGSLGESIIKHLNDNDFVVTLLTRNPEKTKSAFPGWNAIWANYESVDDLTSALRNDDVKHDALIILINRDEDQAQINLSKHIDGQKSNSTHVVPLWRLTQAKLTFCYRSCLRYQLTLFNFS